MSERSYQDAVQVLSDRLGGTWEGVEAEGRDEMVRILQDALGYSDREANDAIDAMIESGTLRYHAEGETAGTVAPPLAVGTGGPLAATSPAPVVVRTGYWQIGEGGVVESTTRKGQVTPT